MKLPELLVFTAKKQLGMPKGESLENRYRHNFVDPETTWRLTVDQSKFDYMAPRKLIGPET